MKERKNDLRVRRPTSTNNKSAISKEIYEKTKNENLLEKGNYKLFK